MTPPLPPGLSGPGWPVVRRPLPQQPASGSSRGDPRDPPELVVDGAKGRQHTGNVWMLPTTCAIIAKIIRPWASAVLGLAHMVSVERLLLSMEYCSSDLFENDSTWW